MRFSTRFSTLLPILFMACLIGCGSSKSNDNGQNGTATSIHGSWTITTTENGETPGTIQTTLISSTCSVSTPVGAFTVQGPNCFIADDNSGQGSISGSGTFFYPPQGVLVGVPTSPVAADSSVPVDLLFVEADQYGDVAVFNGNGTIINGTMTGTWTCNSASPVCSGLSGTFSGTKQ